MPSLPEKYNPGELDKTRKNLGSLTREEAEAMKRKLGGEVGVERADEKVERKYENLKYQNRPGANALVKDQPSRTAYEGEPEGISYFLTGDDGRIKRVVRRFASSRMKGRERIKTDFYCARPEIGVKTTTQAFSSLLTLFVHIPDTVSPRFVLEADSVFGRSVENLVLAVRGLISKSYKTATQAIRRIPVYNEALKVLRSWDIEAMGEELTRLQSKPHNRTVEEFIPLMKILLKPMFLLSRLSIPVHLIPALGKMYELARQFATNSHERDRLNKYYTIAREELPWVFSILKTRFFPLLLKNLSDDFHLPDDFYAKFEPDILEFLEIQESDLLQAEGPVKTTVNPGLQDQGVQGDLPVIQETILPPPIITPLPRIAERGLDLLDRMFPKAGWKNLDAHPDLFAYFQPVLDYPKGAELLSPLDPLQPVITLSLIIQNLLSGVQGMAFGTIRGPGGDPESLTIPIEKAISQFHFFKEEVVAKHYLSTLSDLTRSMERSGRMSTETKRLNTTLLWIRKQYLLPHIAMPVLENLRPQPLNYPPLATQVKRLLDLLSPVAVDVETILNRQREEPGKGHRFTALENPLDPFRFQVETPVSQRLHQLFRKIVVPGQDGGVVTDGRTNRNLLFTVLSLLNLLDQWISQPGSILYLAQPAVLYRTASGDPNDETPVYGVQKRDTAQLLKKQSEKETAQQAEGKALSEEDNLQELYGSFIAREELKKRIMEFQKDNRNFSIAVLKLQGLDPAQYGLAKTLELRTVELVKSLKRPEQVMDQRTDGSILLILPDYNLTMAQKLLRDIVVAGSYRQIPLAAMVVGYQIGFSQEKLLGLVERGFSQGSEYPPQVLGVYSTERGLFEFIEDLPVVAPQSPPERWDEKEVEEIDTAGLDSEF